MEIVQIDLAPRLKLVDEIKKSEGEGSARAIPGGRKPPDTKKLSTAAARLLLTVAVAEAVGDPYDLDPRDVENCERCWLRGERA